METVRVGQGFTLEWLSSVLAIVQSGEHLLTRWAGASGLSSLGIDANPIGNICPPAWTVGTGM